MNTPTRASSSDRPWLKNRRWKTGRIRDQSSMFIIGSLLLALFVDALAFGITYGVWQDHRQGWPLFIMPAILILAGVAASAWAVRQIRVRMKFGRSIFEMETLPGVVGGYLAGTIRVPMLLDASKGVRLEVECVTYVRSTDIGTGKTSSRESTIFEGHQRLGSHLPQEAGNTLIPVSFQIPANAPATGTRCPAPAFWRLRARASQPGADYEAWFVVPVFEVPEAIGVVPKTESIAEKLRKSESAIKEVD